MFSFMVKSLPCEECDDGEIYYDHRETFDAWTQPEIFRLDDVDKLIDGVINEVLVFICNKCETQYRFTFKEIEKKFRKILSNKIITMVATRNLPDPGTVRKSNRVFIYCGKCSGYDGKGSCPLIVYEDCGLKKLPYGF